MNDFPFALEHLLALWRSEPTIASNIVEWCEEPARLGNFEEFPANLHIGLVEALKKRGIQSLYSHQSQAWKSICAGKHTVIVSGTASGKTLCYNLPVLHEILQSSACAFYVFPTKALTADQYENLRNFSNDINAFTGKEQQIENDMIAIYDGDTPSSHRLDIRKNVRILMTNPDMLHLGIFPHHARWADFFHALRYVVIDELHIYRGVFGSHIANLLRRLKRIATFYGAYPQFILTSATISNPGELASRLLDEPVTVIDEDGSPRAKRHFILYNPPFVQEELGIRRSALTESVRLSSDLLAYHIQTILFGHSRRSVEIALKSLKEQEAARDYLHGYRSGYLPRERREIEKQLREGRARLVVATNALELGVDIGNMGAVILAGYPGSIAATRQQAGRAGRRQDSSLAVLVASSSPTDQYLIRHPEYLFERSPEKALINPDNLLILLKHIRCAVFELPFYKGEPFGSISVDLLKSLLELLEQSEELHYAGERYFWMNEQYPASQISLRSTSEDTIVLREEKNGRQITVGEVDSSSATWMVHPGAIYLHEGRMYQVEELDMENLYAQLRSVEVDYYTEPRNQTSVECLSIEREAAVQGARSFYGEILVTTQVIGYRRIHWFTREVLGDEGLSMPPTNLRTMAYWLWLGEDTVDLLRSQGLWTGDPNRYGANWNIQRNLARQRDHFRCQACGAREVGQAHHVHHKVPFRNFPSPLEANHLDNLITLCPACHQRAELPLKMRGGLSGLGYVIHHLASLFLMCDSSDLSSLPDPKLAMTNGEPAIIIYEQVPAGTGLCEGLYGLHQQILNAALELVSHCSCTDGCPSCVGPAGESGSGGKQETLALLNALTLSRAEG